MKNLKKIINNKNFQIHVAALFEYSEYYEDNKNNAELINFLDTNYESLTVEEKNLIDIFAHLLTARDYGIPHLDNYFQQND